jgi:hypothetical protein
MDDIHKQDYLYYGILDFVSKVEDSKTRDLLKDDHQYVLLR